MTDAGRSIALYSGDIHPVHRAWCESVGCDAFMAIKDGWRGVLGPETFRIRQYDTVFCEDAFAMRTAAVHRALGGRFRAVRIVGGGGFYKLASGMDSLKGEAWAARQMDAAIANSDWIAGYARQYMDCTLEVVTPFINPWKYELLQDAEYDAGSDDGLFFSRRYEAEGRKGVGLLEDVARALGDRTTIHMLGEKTDETPITADGLEVHGFVDESGFRSYFEQVGYSVHPSTLDSFNLSVIESMLAGVPPIVTEHTGAKSIVAELDEELIREPTVEDLIAGIEYVLGLDREKREEYSQRCRELAEPYSQENQIEEFKTAFEKVLEET